MTSNLSIVLIPSFVVFGVAVPQFRASTLPPATLYPSLRADFLRGRAGLALRLVPKWLGLGERSAGPGVI
jgi:hypothetical protein